MYMIRKWSDTIQSYELWSDVGMRIVCLLSEDIPVLVPVWRGNGIKEVRHGSMEGGCSQDCKEVSGEKQIKHPGFSFDLGSIYCGG